MGETLLALNELSAWYTKEKDVLRGLSLQLARYETVGLIGLNGAGKTTLLKTISGLISTYRAESVFFCGRPVNFRSREFKCQRYTVFAEDRSFAYFTFREYISYVFAAYEKDVSDAADDIEELVEGFHFGNCADMLIGELSTGNRKKAFLITGFALKPELLLLDEPVNGLDFQSTEYLYQKIAEYKKYGTVLFSSHILEIVTLTSDRVLILKDGQIRQTFERGTDGFETEQIRQMLNRDSGCADRIQEEEK